jgi:hypothetical protein
MKKACITFLLFFAWPTLSLSAVQLSSAGLRVGQVLPSVTRQNALSIGLQGNLLSDKSAVIFQPFFDYWAVSYDKAQARWNRQLFAAGISALKLFNLNNSNAKPFVGGGLGMTFNAWQSTSSDVDAPSSKDHEFDLALNVLGGIEVPVTSSLNGLIQLKYTLAGMADYLGFWIGVSYQLNQDTIQQD